VIADMTVGELRRCAPSLQDTPYTYSLFPHSEGCCSTLSAQGLREEQGCGPDPRWLTFRLPCTDQPASLSDTHRVSMAYLAGRCVRIPDTLHVRQTHT
jgi:hypothetical protein